jgi:hypothetical protein
VAVEASNRAIIVEYGRPLGILTAADLVEALNR